VSYDQVGKRGKEMGRLKPNALRKLDPAPPPAKLPGKETKRRKERNFGYSYEARYFFRKGWQVREEWFATERQRDQSMKLLQRRIELAEFGDFMRNVKTL
jgi:hypothetical protein